MNSTINLIKPWGTKCNTMLQTRKWSRLHPMCSQSSKSNGENKHSSPQLPHNTRGSAPITDAAGTHRNSTCKVWDTAAEDVRLRLASLRAWECTEHRVQPEGKCWSATGCCYLKYAQPLPGQGQSACLVPFPAGWTTRNAS